MFVLPSPPTLQPPIRQSDVDGPAGRSFLHCWRREALLYSSDKCDSNGLGSQSIVIVVCGWAVSSAPTTAKFICIYSLPRYEVPIFSCRIRNGLAALFFQRKAPLLILASFGITPLKLVQANFLLSGTLFWGECLSGHRMPLTSLNSSVLDGKVVCATASIQYPKRA